MLNLTPLLSANGTPCILFLGAHSDDIEIGCGATVLTIAESYPAAKIYWVVFGADGTRAKEAKTSAEDFLSAFENTTIDVHAFRDAYFPDSFARIKDEFEKLNESISPDIIFTHHKDDLHQDHSVIGHLTWNTFRDHLIFEYETPKYDGGLGDPNIFVHVSDDQRKRKIEKLNRHFKTQMDKAWFTEDLFSGLMRLRGVEGSSPTGFAEAFYSRKTSVRWCE